MTAAEKVYELVKTLPTEQAIEVLNFAESLHQKQQNKRSSPIPPGTLTGLRGIAKPTGPTPDNEPIDYADYLTQKYQ